MSSGPVVPMVSMSLPSGQCYHANGFLISISQQVWEGLNVVKTGRQILGATDPKDSAPGTIRGDLCIQVGR